MSTTRCAPGSCARPRATRCTSRSSRTWPARETPRRRPRSSPRSTRRSGRSRATRACCSKALRWPAIPSIPSSPAVPRTTRAMASRCWTGSSRPISYGPPRRRAGFASAIRSCAAPCTTRHLRPGAWPRTSAARASSRGATPHSPCAPTTSSSAPVPATTRPSICSPGRRRSPPRPRPRRRRACTRPRSGCCPRAMPSATRRCSRRAPRRSHRPGACTRAGRPTSRPPRCWRRTRRSGSCTWRAARRWRTSWGSTARPAAGWSARSPRCPTQRPPDRVPRWRRSSGSRPSSPTTRRRCATGRRARCHVELALRGFTTMPDELVAAWPESA